MVYVFLCLSLPLPRQPKQFRCFDPRITCKGREQNQNPWPVPAQENTFFFFQIKLWLQHWNRHPLGSFFFGSQAKSTVRAPASHRRCANRTTKCKQNRHSFSQIMANSHKLTFHWLTSSQWGKNQEHRFLNYVDGNFETNHSGSPTWTTSMTFRIHDTSITCSTLFFGDCNSYIISTSYYKITINLFLHQLVVRITRQVRVKAAAFTHL